MTSFAEIKDAIMSYFKKFANWNDGWYISFSGPWTKDKTERLSRWILAGLAVLVLGAFIDLPFISALSRRARGLVGLGGGGDLFAHAGVLDSLYGR